MPAALSKSRDSLTANPSPPGLLYPATGNIQRRGYKTLPHSTSASPPATLATTSSDLQAAQCNRTQPPSFSQQNANSEELGKNANDTLVDCGYVEVMENALQPPLGVAPVPELLDAHLSWLLSESSALHYNQLLQRALPQTLLLQLVLALSVCNSYAHLRSYSCST